jgi:hypothetical protein
MLHKACDGCLIHEGLKQGEALLLLILNFALEYIIMK